MDRREFLKGTAIAGGLAWASPLKAAEGDPLLLPTRPLGRTGAGVAVLALGGYTGICCRGIVARELGVKPRAEITAGRMP